MKIKQYNPAFRIYSITRYICLAILVLFFTFCNKEQKKVDELEGKWKIETFSINNKRLINDTLATNYFEFMACKKAYTASCYGVFTAVSNDTLIYKNVTDTFRYNVNENNFTITKVQTWEGRFLINYYKIKKLENGVFEMGNDTLTVIAKKI